MKNVKQKNCQFGHYFDQHASIEDLKEALDYKEFIRVDPYMRRTGTKMERQIFDDKDTD